MVTATKERSIKRPGWSSICYKTQMVIGCDFDKKETFLVDEWYIWQIQDWRFAHENASWSDDRGWISRTMSLS